MKTIVRAAARAFAKTMVAIFTVACLFLAIDFGSRAFETQVSYIRNRLAAFTVLSLLLAGASLLFYRWSVGTKKDY